MISLKKYMDRYEEGLTDALTAAWRESLNAFGAAGAKAIPALTSPLGERLQPFAERLTQNPGTGGIAEIGKGVQEELQNWSVEADKASRENVKQVREIMMAVAASAAALAERDDRYTNRFQKLTDQFQTAAKASDLTKMRQSVIAAASEMKVCVAGMAEESERAVSQLRSEVESYRSQLTAYQKRDTTDALTGLANRLAIDGQLEDRMAWASRFCLAVLDLNGFKQTNDTYGHAAGDELLVKFAGELKSVIRSTDFVGRWGGDEFVVVLDEELEEAERIVRRMTGWSIGEYELQCVEGVRIKITAAVGVAQWDGKESALELFSRADSLMYQDKKTMKMPVSPAGRNRACA